MRAIRQALQFGARFYSVSNLKDFHHLPKVTTSTIHKYDSCFKRFAQTSSDTCEKTSETEENLKSETQDCLKSNVIHEKKGLAILQVKLKLMFTCKKCNTRNSKIISRIAYEKGIVIARCDGCKNNHLIADNLNWFQDVTFHHGRRNIETMLREKGETVRRIRDDTDGYMEILMEEEIKLIEQNKNLENREQEELNGKKLEIEKVGNSEKM